MISEKNDDFYYAFVSSETRQTRQFRGVTHYFSDCTASGARSSAQEGTGIGSVGVYMLLILPEVLKSAVKISRWAKERKIQISISMESRASCELSHSTNIQWISMRNSPLQDVL